MEDYDIMNLSKQLVKELRSFKSVQKAQDFKLTSLDVETFIKALDIIYTHLSVDGFYTFVLS
jgi:hypothetical protein